MKRRLITLTEEQDRKAIALAGGSNGNVSGFIQHLIDQLYDLKEKRDANESVQQKPLRSVGGNH